MKMLNIVTSSDFVLGRRFVENRVFVCFILILIAMLCAADYIMEIWNVFVKKKLL